MDLKLDKGYKNLTILCDKCREHLADMIAEHVPPAGNTQRVFVRFDNPVKSWKLDECGIAVVQDLLTDNGRRLEIFAVKQGTDMKISNFVAKGSNEDIIAYLNCNELTAEMIKAFEHFGKD